MLLRPQAHVATVTPDSKPFSHAAAFLPLTPLTILYFYLAGRPFFPSFHSFTKATTTYISTQVSPTTISTFNTNCHLPTCPQHHYLNNTTCLLPRHVSELSTQLDSKQTSEPNKRDSKQPNELQLQEQQPTQPKSDETADDMAGKLGQSRPGQTFHPKPAQGKSYLSSPTVLHVTDALTQDRYFPSSAGSRGSVSPSTRPPKVTVHNGGGTVPKDEPRSGQVEYEKVWR